MTCKTNKKFKSITKGLMGPNIIFPAAYILFTANACPGFFSHKKADQISDLSLSSESLKTHISASHESEGLNEPIGDALGVKSILGRGTVLDLDGCPCGVFVASANEEVFIVKLPSEGGWMQLVEQSDQGAQTGILSVHYDAAPDPRMIKVDYGLFNLLLQQLGQSFDMGQYGSDKEGFWRKIEKDDAWRNIEFFYKPPVGDTHIFTESGITPSTQWTKELYQKLSSTSSLISSKLPISAVVASTTLQDLEKIGFLLVKDEKSLVHLVKSVLKSDPEWGTKAAVADTKEYITCPAELVDDVLQFDSTDLDLQLQDDYLSLPLEDYKFAYCYLNDGVYYRLIALDNINIYSSVTRDIEPCDQLFYTDIITPALVAPVVAPKQPVAEDETVIPASIPTHAEKQVAKPVIQQAAELLITSPRSVLSTNRSAGSPMPSIRPSVPPPPPPSMPGANGLIPPPPPMPEKEDLNGVSLLENSAPLQGQHPVSNGSVNRSAGSPMPPINASVPPPPPPPPLMRGANGSIPPPPPMPGFCSNINASVQGAGQKASRDKIDGKPKSKDPSMMDELQRKLNESNQNALLAEIKQVTRLKKVEPISKIDNNKYDDNFTASLKQTANLMIKKHFNNDQNDSEDNDEENQDDWL